ncbi:hypothetical protein [Bradyrhizobium quebecense]|uniref:hypothetical protein n=1 Tax=Bradyrhizobium quebecense TaxID=2748629 RepID=UPI003B835F09
MPGLVLACFISSCLAGPAFGKDRDDDSGAPPNIYLDLRTSYATVPAGALPVGFGSPALFSALQSLALANGSSLPTSVSLPSRQSLAVDLPLTVDVTDAVSLYAGISGTTSYGPAQGWSAFDVTSWNVGFQADLYSQNGGSIPTITWQSTITQAIPNGPTGTTTFNNILEFDYAFDKDGTRGILAGIQDTRVEVATDLARIEPNIIGYVGGYYQWPSNWKFTGRVGVQHFGGAQLLNFTPIQSFTGPILRLDLDRMDDNDNRLFGVTAQIIWVPKPSYQLTLRTPLYLVRN